MHSAQCNREREFREPVGHGTAICVAHTANQNDTPPPTKQLCYKHTFCPNAPSTKNSSSLYFRKNITCLSVGLLRIGRDFSVFHKTVCLVGYGSVLFHERYDVSWAICCFMSGMLFHERYAVSWAICCFMSGMLFHERYAVSWAICCFMSDMLFHERYAVSWAICCFMSDMLFHERYAVSWAICCFMSGMLFHERYAVSWAVCCFMSDMLFHERYAVSWAICCRCFSYDVRHKWHVILITKHMHTSNPKKHRACSYETLKSTHQVHTVLTFTTPLKGSSLHCKPQIL